jgi:hypothetical protein
MSTRKNTPLDHWTATPDGRVIDRAGSTICQCYQLPLDPVSPSAKAEFIAATCNRFACAEADSLLITSTEAKALRHIIRYCFATEAQHYAECEPDERAGHIFEDLRIVALAAGETTREALAAMDVDLASKGVRS